MLPLMPIAGHFFVSAPEYVEMNDNENTLKKNIQLKIRLLHAITISNEHGFSVFCFSHLQNATYLPATH